MKQTIATSIWIAALASCDVPTHSQPAEPTWEIHARADADDGLPVMLRGRLGTTTGAIDSAHDANRALAAALVPIAAAFRVPPADLVPVRVQHDALGMTHVAYAQQRDGLPVIGGDLVVHVDRDGVVASVNGTIRDAAPLATATVTDVEAGERARLATGDVDVRAVALTYVIATRDAAMHLAWQVDVVGRAGLLVDEAVYIDATSGQVVDRRPRVFTARDREIRHGNNCSYPLCFNTQAIGTEANPPTGDAIATAAYQNTGITYDCYAALFGRDSYNGTGGRLTSLVHVKFLTPQGGTSGNNAAWTGSQMVYGDGDGTTMLPLANSLDVTAHELTHGVTTSTANLAYQNEPGALNEGMSDIMAAVCEAWHDGAVSADTWLVGEDIFTPATANDALRYMANPTADAPLYPPDLGGSRDYYPERYQGTQDNGGVHLNSGIPNLAFYLLVSGGTHPRGKTTFTVPAIGIAKAGAIFQRALTQGYLTANSTLAQARTQTELVASQIHPEAVTAVGLAWAAVGVGAPPAADTTPPTVAIAAPADNATVNAGFEVTVTAADDVAVTRVELSIDGAAAGSDTTAPYSFPTPASLPPGSHVLVATAFDTANQASDTATVTVASGAACTGDEQCQGDEVCTDGTCHAPTTCMDASCPDDEEEPAGCCSTGADPLGSAAGCLVFLFCVRRRRAARR